MLQLGVNRAQARGGDVPGPCVRCKYRHRPCREVNEPDRTPEELALNRGLRDLCGKLAEGFEAEVDQRFDANYDRWYDNNGWVDEAYVNYMKMGIDDDPSAAGTYEGETELLIESVHKFASRPIVVFNLGAEPAPAGWTAERFPRLVVFNVGAALPQGVRFNFNKLRAMMLAQVRTGIAVDSDMFVFRGFDSMFRRTKAEVTEAYPYPILPVHWMSREEAPEWQDSYSCFKFKCPDCPKRTLRWGHAHPTWTFHALPFIGDLLAGAHDHPTHVLGLSPEASKVVVEDEDYFNVGLWLVNATKQWCKFDIAWVKDFTHFLNSDANEMNTWGRFADKKWFPEGIPLAFYAAHGAKNTTETRLMLDRLAAIPQEKLPPQVYFNFKWYSDEAPMLLDVGNRDGQPRCLL